ncbi:3D-(3,5/4)-trihydroxycyclohexane-1,2-dione acylhydrolase (decyclizing) [Paremcibacter congregatus]|uniref:3D-(3,5/4)-trihydroxycyclohexane-1,2-dione acylhydrolase (Decyclizing) n=1 Tax=Paremcibacter congregatus TaxID=2043170 RepID=A0A2G4YW31_9PROT|nr:3D-(3,5/4)-trihydroxycyclohexane-1,2-dione acylhydrolase (decyclizing) [Paremcibacter congregatus]PHZ86538.1 3D-(3,5/4)-trihydroxycyclohexane-1,2-dione acylhydrolase (decyclizing) [Paremcibacter congregatus]QDE26342.1 3D-(3,5/4)-trihydroxycyclohexane-1,2-dione acylhydrolase (decyclizing) [Paremcibacter congregatus]
MKTIRLTTAQALVRYMMAQRVIVEERDLPLFAGTFAIFGHGNVAGMGEALYQVRDQFPTFRAHNEQAMAHAAIAYAKTRMRRQMMACTTSVGPGATNMITAAALAHVNRLPLLLLPGDVFANRRPDPVLQQIENFTDPTTVANDCFKPVSRYWDRITRPEQLITSLPQAIRTLTSPSDCGPVTLCLPEDVQAESYDYPAVFFERRYHDQLRPEPDRGELTRGLDILSRAKNPLIIAGGGVLYSGATDSLASFAERYMIPVAETQAGKGSLPWNHKSAVGAVGVTGSAAANELAREADVVFAVGCRLSDFTTGSRSLFQNPDVTLLGLNVCAFDSIKHRAEPLVCDAKVGLEKLDHGLSSTVSATRKAWYDRAYGLAQGWHEVTDQLTAKVDGDCPTDAQVVGAVQRSAGAQDVVVCAAGGLPGELHKHWRTDQPGGYHVEYGYSCMGYEIAGGLGVKMAKPDSTVFVVVGDGSYLMMNSEIATSVLLNRKLVIVVLDNGGFGCINRLQQGCGNESFNNLFAEGTRVDGEIPQVDFAAHAASLGAESTEVTDVAGLEQALKQARRHSKTSVIVIRTDAKTTTQEGGSWWDVPMAEVSSSEDVSAARQVYQDKIKHQKVDG